MVASLVKLDETRNYYISILGFFTNGGFPQILFLDTYKYG